METTLAWVAGLLDGEGAFSIKRSQRNGRYHYQIWLVCGMSDIPQNRKALTKLQELFGGNVSSQKEKLNMNRKDKISWAVVSQDALKCLKRILPYLVIKKDQAELLIKFQEEHVSRTGPKVNPIKWAKQEELFYALRELHPKGNLRLQRLSEKTPKGEATV